MLIDPLIAYYKNKNPTDYITPTQIAKLNVMIKNSDLETALKDKSKVKVQDMLFFHIAFELNVFYKDITDKAIKIYEKIGPQVNVKKILEEPNAFYGSDFYIDITNELNYRANQIKNGITQSYYQEQPFEYREDI